MSWSKEKNCDNITVVIFQEEMSDMFTASSFFNVRIYWVLSSFMKVNEES